jgi:hypothetical protein
VPININGGSRRAGGWWAKHLENKATNERVEVVEIVGLNATTLPEAFREMHAVSRGTKCDNYFYQANINPRADEHLTPEQWQKAVDTLEKNLGLTGQPRFVIEHEKEGRTHQHVIWSRIDITQMRAIPDSLTAAIHERTSRELEISFDLERGKSILVADRDFDRPERRPKKHETIRALDSGIDPQTMKVEVSALWCSADNAHSFKAALEANGYVLARGDRRDMVIIDQAGDVHSLGRRAGVKAAELRERMKVIDPASLPSVIEARAQQRAVLEAKQAPTHDRDAANAAAIAGEEAVRTQEGRQQPEAAERAGKDRPAARGRYAALQPEEPAPEVKVERPLGRTAGAIRTACALSQSPTELEDALAVRGISLAQVDPEEAYASERRAAFAKATGHFMPTWREAEIVAVDGRGTVYRLNERTTGDGRAEIEGRLAGLDRSALMNVADTQEAMRAASWAAVRADRQAEREQVRPASRIEAVIADALKSTTTGTAFAAALDEKGLAVARVTPADVLALDALRNDDGLAAAAGIEATGRHYPQLIEGDLAALTRHGEVFRLSPQKLDFSEIDQRLADVQTRLPSVVEARAVFETVRERAADERTQRNADYLAGRAEQVGIFAGQQEVRHAAATAEHAVHETFEASAATAEHAMHSGGRVADGIAKMVTDFLSGVFNFFFPGPRLTRQEAEIACGRADNARAHQAAQQEQAEAREQIVEQSRRQRQEREIFGEFGPPRATDRGRGRDDDYGRERERY